MEEKPIAEELKFLLNGFFQRKSIRKSSDVNEIFDAGIDDNLWDFWNYEPIEIIVEEFAADDPELTSLIETYRQDLESYKITEKLIDHITAVHLTPEEEEELKPTAKYDHQYYKSLSMKLDMKFTNRSLKYIDELWNKFANLHGLPSRVAVLHHVRKGCVSIVWLIPSRLATHILDAAPLSGDFYHKHNITRVELDGICIYPEETKHHDLYISHEDKDQQCIVPVVAESQGNYVADH